MVTQGQRRGNRGKNGKDEEYILRIWKWGEKGWDGDGGREGEGGGDGGWGGGEGFD